MNDVYFIKKTFRLFFKFKKALIQHKTNLFLLTSFCGFF